MSGSTQTEQTPSTQLPPSGKSNGSKASPLKRAARRSPAEMAADRAKSEAAPAAKVAKSAEPAKTQAVTRTEAATRHAPASAKSPAQAAQDPLAVALLQKFPADGAKWSIDKAKSWLDAAAAALKMTCEFPGSLSVTMVPATA